MAAPNLTGKQLQKLRLKHCGDLSMSVFAKNAGMSHVYLRKIEKDNREPSANVIAAYERALGIALGTPKETPQEETLVAETAITPVHAPHLVARDRGYTFYWNGAVYELRDTSNTAIAYAQTTEALELILNAFIDQRNYQGLIQELERLGDIWKFFQGRTWNSF